MKQIIFSVILIFFLPSISSAKSECHFSLKSGRSGPSVFICGKKKEKYYFGDMVCPKERYTDVFCHAKHTGSGADCYADRLNKETIKCREEKDKALAKINSPIRLNKEPAHKGASQ